MMNKSHDINLKDIETHNRLFNVSTIAVVYYRANTDQYSTHNLITPVMINGTTAVVFCVLLAVLNAIQFFVILVLLTRQKGIKLYVHMYTHIHITQYVAMILSEMLSLFLGREEEAVSLARAAWHQTAVRARAIRTSRRSGISYLKRPA